MDLDPRTPVIVGAGQVLNRVDRGETAREPAELATEAVAAAVLDAGTDLASRADVVAMVPVISWRYADPARIVADAIGARDAATWYPAMGGNTPQMLLNRIASRIAGGELGTAVLCGAEAWRSRTNARRAEEHLEWTKQPGEVAPDWTGEPFSMGHPAEHAKAIVTPLQTYPLFETAIMHAEIEAHPDLGVAGHIERVGRMWAGFSEVAAANEYAWNRTALTAEEITTPTADNRYVGWPYTKSMVSFPDVDMASALVVTSAEEADAAGVPRDRWVFCWSGTDSKDRVMSQRESFTGSPSIGIAGRRCLELSSVGIDDVAHLDVYSCFPSAVELFCREIGIDPLSRPLTVYGGLAFAGGPWNNPVGHALATMVGLLRGEPGGLGFVTANGGNVDKHAFGLLGSDPPPSGWRHEVPQDEIDALPGREILDSHEGTVTVEAWTVMHDRANEPERFHAACLDDAGRRCWAVSHDAGVMAAATAGDLGGRAGTVDADGTLRLD